MLCTIRIETADNLVGVYLHGSLAMICFNPDRSDIDILAVTKRDMTVDTKFGIAQSLLHLSKYPCPIEISFLREQDLTPWKHPTVFDLHYSEMWREQYKEDLASGVWKKWNEKYHEDPDLAAHITITLNRGICLYGQPIKETFPIVPKKDYIASLLYDFEDARDGILENPVYSVLNLCRVYWYLLEERICSKDEAGTWAISFLPEKFQEVVAQALEIYRGNRVEEKFDDEALKRFSQHVDKQVKALLKT